MNKNGRFPKAEQLPLTVRMGHAARSVGRFVFCGLRASSPVSVPLDAQPNKALTERQRLAGEFTELETRLTDKTATEVFVQTGILPSNQAK